MNARAWPAAAAAAAYIGGAAFAEIDWPDPLESRWRAQIGLFEEAPMCMLNGAASYDMPSALFIGIYWRARDGIVLHLKGRLDENTRVRVEYDSGDAWDVKMEPEHPRFDGRRVLLPPDVAVGILRNLGQERALTMELSLDNGASLRYRMITKGGKLAVPMFEACVKAMTVDPPKNWYQPKKRYMVMIDASKRCGLQHMFYLGDAPVFVYLIDDHDNGEIVFSREINTGGRHGPFRRRETPDRVEARQLFTADFDLVEEFRYDIPFKQLNEITTDLAAGKMREFSLTTPSGSKSTLALGGPQVKPAAAMFAACRTETR
jgi:hypothetical protein